MIILFNGNIYGIQWISIFCVEYSITDVMDILMDIFLLMDVVDMDIFITFSSGIPLEILWTVNGDMSWNLPSGNLT